MVKYGCGTKWFGRIEAQMSNSMISIIIRSLGIVICIFLTYKAYSSFAESRMLGKNYEKMKTLKPEELKIDLFKTGKYYCTFERKSEMKYSIPMLAVSAAGDINCSLDKALEGFQAEINICSHDGTKIYNEKIPDKYGLSSKAIKPNEIYEITSLGHHKPGKYILEINVLATAKNSFASCIKFYLVNHISLSDMEGNILVNKIWSLVLIVLAVLSVAIVLLPLYLKK